MKKLFYLPLLLLGSLSYAESFTYYEEVRVSSSQPEYAQTRGGAREECWDERVESSSGGGGNNGTVGAVIGGVAGGVLGHQVGDIS